MDADPAPPRAPTCGSPTTRGLGHENADGGAGAPERDARVPRGTGTGGPAGGHVGSSAGLRPREGGGRSLQDPRRPERGVWAPARPRGHLLEGGQHPHSRRRLVPTMAGFSVKQIGSFWAWISVLRCPLPLSGPLPGPALWRSLVAGTFYCAF